MSPSKRSDGLLPVPDPSVEPPFFIVGFPRSGSTLLRAILTRHPDVFIPPENGGLGPMIATANSLRSQEWPTVVDAVIREFERGYESSHWQLDLESVRRTAYALSEEQRSIARLVTVFYQQYGQTHAATRGRWGDKTMPGDCTYLFKIALTFPKARFIHIVRNGRDAVASAMRQEMFHGDLSLAAVNWKNCMVQWRSFEQGLCPPARSHVVRYENLVTDPASEIQSLAQFLDLEPNRSMLEYGGASDLADVNSIGHHASVREPIRSSSVGRAESQFDATELKTLHRVLGRQLSALGYH